MREKIGLVSPTPTSALTQAAQITLQSSSMRNLTRTLLVLCLLIAAPYAAQAQSAARPLTIGTVEPILTLDPADSDNFFVWEYLTPLYTGLTRQQAGSLAYELALAASHRVSEDGLTHTFTIRADAAFNDGTPITAVTFAESITRSLTLGRARAVIAPYVASANANADGTLQLTLTAPLPYIYQLLALPPFFPTHPDSFPRNKIERAPKTLITNGVYRIKAFDFGLITYEADPTWRGSPPASAELSLKRYERASLLRREMENGAIDLIWRGLPPEDGALLLAQGGFREERAPSLQTFYLAVTQNKEPYDVPQARQALMYLADREQAVSVGLKGYGSALYTLLPSQLAAADDFTYPKFDLDQAREVLTAGGFSRYKQLSSELQTARMMYGESVISGADQLFGRLSALDSVRIARFDTEPRTFLDQIERRAYRLILLGFTPLVAHPQAILSPLLTGPVAVGAEYHHPQVRDLLAQAALSGDAALYTQIQAVAAEDVVLIPLWQGVQTLYAREDVRGVLIEPNFLLRYEQLAR